MWSFTTLAYSVPPFFFFFFAFFEGLPLLSVTFSSAMPLSEVTLSVNTSCTLTEGVLRCSTVDCLSLGFSIAEGDFSPLRTSASIASRSSSSLEVDIGYKGIWRVNKHCIQMSNLRVTVIYNMTLRTHPIIGLSAGNDEHNYNYDMYIVHVIDSLKR